MPNELSKPTWSRWAPIVRTSPSGKTLFVCLVCGDLTPGPTKECPRKDEKPHLDPRLESHIGEAVSCHDVEAHINEEITKNLPDHLTLDWNENKLRGVMQRYCGSCHGYGCQACLGIGRRWK